MKKRLFSILTVCAMVLSLMPTVSFAEDIIQVSDWKSLQTQLSETENKGKTIQLCDNVTAGSNDTCLKITQSITLDLNGWVIDRGNPSFSDKGMVLFGDAHGEVNFKIKDSNADKNHPGYVDADGLWHLGDAPNGETPVTLYGGIITGGRFDQYGAGAICLKFQAKKIDGTWTESTFTMEGGTIAGNRALDGEYSTAGGVYIAGDKTTFNLEGGKIEYNVAKGGYSAGGILTYGNDAIINIKSGLISHNVGEQGGGIYLCLGNPTLNMSGGEISYNKAEYSEKDKDSGYGGGLCMDPGATVNLTGGSIVNNYAELDGGGVYCDTDSSVVIAGGSISSNTAGRNGGGVYNDGSSDFIISGGSVEYNNAANNGGGLHAIGYGNFIISGGSVEYNNAANDGGGIYLDSTHNDDDSLDFSNVSLIGGNIEYNTCGGNGCGVAFMSETDDEHYDYDKLSVGGTAVINNNKTSNNIQNNLYFNLSNKMNIGYDVDWNDIAPTDGMNVGITIEGGTKTLNYDEEYEDAYFEGYGDTYDWCEYWCDWLDKPLELGFDLDDAVQYFHSDNKAYKPTHSKKESVIDDYGDDVNLTYHYYELVPQEIPFFDTCGGLTPDFDDNGIPTSVPECEGLKFQGWYTAKDGGELVNDGTDFKNGYSEFTVGVTYYAHWADASGVAQVGTTNYKTLAEAVAAANGEVITLLADNTENISLAKDQSFKLDKNGYTFEDTVTTSGESEGYEIDVVTENGITIYTSSLLPYIGASVVNNDDGSCSLTVHPFKLYSALFVAGYKGGELVYLEQDDPESEAYEDDGIETYSFDSELDAIKIFAWDMEDYLMQPLCDAKVILQSEWK